MCSPVALPDEAQFIQWIVEEVEQHLDTHPDTWNRSSGTLQFAGESVRYCRGPDILTLTVRGQEIMLLR